MKYIIDVPDSFVDITNGLHIPMDKQGDFRIDTELKLIPYTEPDRKAIEDAQEEAWEFAKQVSIMKPQDKEECWGTAEYNTINLGYSYKEAKAEYEAWKSDKDSKIKVGDELKSTMYEDLRIVVFEDKNDCYVGLGIRGNRVFYTTWQKTHNYEKTGRHFSQVTDLLKEMKGECDEVSD